MPHHALWMSLLILHELPISESIDRYFPLANIMPDIAIYRLQFNSHVLEACRRLRLS
jgi:hypothetical protein